METVNVQELELSGHDNSIVYEVIDGAKTTNKCIELQDNEAYGQI